MMKLYGLTTDNRRRNILVGSKEPTFAWKVKTEKRNVYQKNYRIQVWDEAGDFAWDSGIVNSARMTGIRYEGKELRSGERMNWRVLCTFISDDDVMSAEGESIFETAYYNREDWKGTFIGETKDREYH